MRVVPVVKFEYDDLNITSDISVFNQTTIYTN